MPRITRSGITIDNHGIWLYQGTPITNQNVLRYFKQQLRREQKDSKAYYIENHLGSLVEHSFLERVHGFPLMVRSLQPRRNWYSQNSCKSDAQSDHQRESGQQEAGRILFELQLDSGEQILSRVENFYIFSTQAVIVLIAERANLPARLSRVAMNSLRPYLYQNSEGRYFLALPDCSCRHLLHFISPEKIFFN